MLFALFSIKFNLIVINWSLSLSLLFNQKSLSKGHITFFPVRLLLLYRLPTIRIVSIYIQNISWFAFLVRIFITNFLFARQAQLEILWQNSPIRIQAQWITRILSDSCWRPVRIIKFMIQRRRTNLEMNPTHLQSSYPWPFRWTKWSFRFQQKYLLCVWLS